MNIGRWSVNNPVLLNVLMVAVLLLGTFSIIRLPREQFSEVPFYWATIIVPYPGASAADVEQAVTVPIENEMDGLKKLKQIRSLTREGIATIQVEFDDGISKADFTRLYQEVQTRFNKVSLPEGVLDAVIDDFSSSDFLPVIEVILSGAESEELLNRLALQLQDRLEAVDEVENVVLVGNRERHYRVEVDRQKAEALSVSLGEISQTIQNRALAVPGGLLETPSREFLIRTDGEVQTVDDLVDLVIRYGAEGSIIRIGDVAACHDTLDPATPVRRLNGQTAIALQITKVVNGNSIAVVNDVKQAVREFSQNSPDSPAISYFNDSTVRIRKSISVLLTNALSGFILLILILGLFLGIRNAFITALGIPVTFALTFVILEMLGATLNSNSLFGLVLVLGLIVDHAIVIVENGYRFRSSGLSRRDAAIAGTNEIVWPVTSATLTTVAAFLPLMLLPGILGRFFRVIPLVVSVALVVSTLDAFVFLPLHFAEWSARRQSRAGDWFRHVTTWFIRLFRRLYAHRMLVIITACVIMIGILSLLGTVRQDLFSGEDYTYFFIDIELPTGSLREKTESIVAQFETTIRDNANPDEIRSISSTIGQSDAGGQLLIQNNVAQIVVDLAELSKERTRPISSIVDEVKEHCAAIPGTERVQYRRVQSGPPVDPPISFRLFGDNYAELRAISGKIRTKLREYPELYNIKDNLEQGTPELRIRIDRIKAARYGLPVSVVGAYIRAAFDGITAARVFDRNDEIDIIVQYSPGKRESVDDLFQLKIPTPQGNQVPLSSLGSIREEGAVAAIKRVDGKREVTITANAWDKQNIRTINKALETMYEWEIRPVYPDVTSSTGGEFAEFSNILLQILRLFLIGLFCIYLLLGSQFKSYLQPLLILITLPFAFAGVVFFLLLSGTPFSTTVLYAGVALAGIAVNDSIVLISYINERRREGMTIRDAVFDGVTIRLRPVVLTSVTTIAGLFPTAVGIGGYSRVWGPMASTIIVGLLFSTFTALVLIPMLYSVVESVREKWFIKSSVPMNQQ